MDAKTWQIVKGWLADVAELPAEERDAYLARHCADEALRGEMLELLADRASLSGIVTPAALARGARLGRYEVIEAIGAGGMGEVYRARDSRLGRDVAVKVVPALWSGDRDRLSRLEREARVLASLNHPNIAQIHGLEESDDRRALVLEFVEGETLAERIARGPIPVAEAVSIARQICEALEAAHDRGIIHRDLKPANVKVRPDGTVKVLDFGLAKIAAPESMALPSQPISTDGTGPGLILGTAAYMSPEQASGKPVDRRADLWALGVVLMEMLTGRRVFDGETASHVIAAVLQADPEWRTLPARTPVSVERLLRRCLSKAPSDRLDSAAAARLELLDAQSSLRTDQASAGRSSRRRAIVLAALVGILGVSLAGWTTFGGRVASPPLPGPIASSVALKPRAFVLIGAFENRTGSPSLDGIVEAHIERELAMSQFLSLVPRPRIDDALALMRKPLNAPLSAETARDVCIRDGGIRTYVTGRIDRIGKQYEIFASAFHPADGHAVITVEAEAADDNALPSAIRQLSNRLRADLGESAGAIRETNQELEKVTTVSPQAVRLFSDGLRAFNVADFSEADADFKEAIAQDANFASAYIWLAWTAKNANEPPEKYVPLAQHAMDLAGSASLREREWIAGSYYTLTKQPELARGQYAALLRKYPDDFWALNNLLMYSEARGDPPHATLDLRLRAADAQPTNFRVQAETAVGVLAVEGIDAARPRMARARQVMPDLDDDQNKRTPTLTLQARISVLLFPAHDLWTQGRAAEAARVLDDLSHRPEFGLERNWTVGFLGKLRLALGQLHLAESTFNRIQDLELRDLDLAEVALLRGDRAGIAAHVKTSQPDFPVVSLLIRAGRIDEASRVLPAAIRFRDIDHLDPAWSANEIQEARGNRERIQQALQMGPTWTNWGPGSVRVFWYSETLAHAAANIGDLKAAIKVLEDTAPYGSRSYGIYATAGVYAMRDQKLLADLYRQDGQVDKARAIERDLLARLAVADPDYPLLVALKQRIGQ
jgi:serine/threonine protein kinase/tetratricopeptide (TPR) repeat protein